MKLLITGHHGQVGQALIQQVAAHNFQVAAYDRSGLDIADRAAVLQAVERERGDEMQAVNKTFTPEFRNRLDAVIPFAPLDAAVIARIVDKFLLQLEQQLLAKKVEAEFTPELRAYLAEQGFDPQMGARPMHRLIQNKLRRALADELLFGRLADGGFVRIGWNTEKEEALLEFEKNTSTAAV